MSLTLYLVLSVFAVAYLIQIFKFDSHHIGPFSSKTISVKTVVVRDNEYVEHIRPVGAFDYFRRVFRAYAIAEDEPHKWFYNSSFWDCPYCLGFWCSFLVSWQFYYLYEGDVAIRLFFTGVTHFAITLLAAKVNLYETG